VVGLRLVPGKTVLGGRVFAWVVFGVAVLNGTAILIASPNFVVPLLFLPFLLAAHLME
jgi:hypothetical protein